jgi:hypothetical protein
MLDDYDIVPVYELDSEWKNSQKECFKNYLDEDNDKDDNLIHFKFLNKKTNKILGYFSFVLGKGKESNTIWNVCSKHIEKGTCFKMLYFFIKYIVKLYSNNDLLLKVYKDNNKAIKCYEKLGFKVIKDIDRENVYIMHKKVKNTDSYHHMYIVHHICNDIDLELLCNIRPEYKDLILNTAKESKTWLSNAILNFNKINPLSLSINHISVLLTPYINGNNYNINPNKKMELKYRLAKAKENIDIFVNNKKDKEDYYSKVTNVLDQFSDYRKRLKRELGTKYITNAFLKCWEMIQEFDLIPYNKPDNYTVFCNAEFPGAFIFAIHQYINTYTYNKKYKWFGNSLWPGDDKKGNILGDEFNLYKKYPDNWLMSGGSKERDGNVLNSNMIDYISKKLHNTVDLYTSDIGIGLDISNFNLQEEVEANLNLGQVLAALLTLKKGGHMICKMFLFFTPFNISLLSLLNELFDEFYISKPITSRPANSEIYIIGKRYKGYKQDVIDILKYELYNWNPQSVNHVIYNVKEEFYSRILYASYEIYQRQINFINLNVAIANYFYNHNLPANFSYMIVDNNNVTGTNQTPKEIVSLRQDMVRNWKRKYKEHLLHQNIQKL